MLCQSPQWNLEVMVIHCYRQIQASGEIQERIEGGDIRLVMMVCSVAMDEFRTLRYDIQIIAIGLYNGSTDFAFTIYYRAYYKCNVTGGCRLGSPASIAAIRWRWVLLRLPAW
jgi:hypothetical protein